MIWFLMLFDTFLVQKIFSTIRFGQCLFLSTSLSIYLMQLEITTIIQSTIIYANIFSHFSILYIFIFYAKVIFSGFLSCISKLFTVFWKFLSCIVLFFHETLYCIPVLLKKIAVGGLLVKPLLHSIFFTDCLNHKTVNKTTCRTPAQILANYGYIS